MKLLKIPTETIDFKPTIETLEFWKKELKKIEDKNKFKYTAWFYNGECCGFTKDIK